MLRNKFYWYKKIDNGSNEIYVWNPLISYIRLSLILLGIYGCATNQILIASLSILAYVALYLRYAYKNKTLIYLFNHPSKKDDIETSGHRYSFKNPLQILVR